MLNFSPVLVDLRQLPEKFLLEAHHYTDPSWEPIEQGKIFQESWIYLGDRDRLSPGQVWSTRVAGRSILVTCLADGQVRAFNNLCPHRAAELCPKPGVEAVKHLVCPYHAWVYDLDGKLVGPPSRERFPAGFEPQNYDLQPIQIEAWSGFLFICFAERGPSLEEYLGCMEPVSAHRRPETRRLLTRSHSVACNWKNYHDHTLCDYHVAIAHRHTLHQLQGPIKHYGHQFNFYSNLLHTPVTTDWQAANRKLPDLPDGGRDQLLTYGIFPNLHLIAMPNGLMAWIRIDPLTSQSCDVHLEVYGIPEYSPPLEQLEREFEAFMLEDKLLAESVQRGYASGKSQPGPVNQLEARILHQQKLIVARLESA